MNPIDLKDILENDVEVIQLLTAIAELPRHKPRDLRVPRADDRAYDDFPWKELQGEKLKPRLDSIQKHYSKNVRPRFQKTIKKIRKVGPKFRIMTMRTVTGKVQTEPKREPFLEWLFEQEDWKNYRALRGEMKYVIEAKRKSSKRSYDYARDENPAVWHFQLETKVAANLEKQNAKFLKIANENQPRWCGLATLFFHEFLDSYKTQAYFSRKGVLQERTKDEQGNWVCKYPPFEDRFLYTDWKLYHEIAALGRYTSTWKPDLFYSLLTIGLMFSTRNYSEIEKPLVEEAKLLPVTLGFWTTKTYKDVEASRRPPTKTKRQLDDEEVSKLMNLPLDITGVEDKDD